MLIDKREIERVKRANELVGFIRRRGVSLTPRGKQLVGLCIFHAVRGLFTPWPTTEQATQQPTQPNPVSTVSATLPQEEIPTCYPDDLPITVTINQVNRPDRLALYQINGAQSLRIGVDLTFSFTNMSGEPVAGTVSESVEALEGDPVYQDPRILPLVNGTVSDTVATPDYAVPTGSGPARVFVTRQLITITLTTNSGIGVRDTRKNSHEHDSWRRTHRR